MKKLSLILALVMLLGCFGGAFAEDFNLNFVRENSNLYTIDVDSSRGIAFIESGLTAKDRSFVHKYESSTRYSSTKFDMLVIDYGTSSQYPVCRLWVNYMSDTGYQNIKAVTFNVNGQQFTFTDIDDPDFMEHDEDGYIERVLIKFDLDNLDFLIALEKMLPDEFEGFDTIKISMTLHGDEDITVELGRGFMLDFFLLQQAILECNAVGEMSKTNGSPMTVK